MALPPVKSPRSFRSGLGAGLAACALVAGLSACSSGESKGGAADGFETAGCADRRARPELVLEMRRSDAELRRVLGTTRAPDPGVAASTAAARGDFRLAAVTSPEGISTELYDAQCRVLGGLAPWTIRALAWAPDLAAAEGRGQDDPVTDFGRRYNAAMMADPRYPYGDVCRPVSEAGPVPEIVPGEAIEQPYGFAELRPRHGRETLAVAARHGAVADIEGLLRVSREGIDQPDMFGLTPLAWAITYHRWPAAEALLEAGATPTGSQCQTVIDRGSPLQVARLMRWTSMIARLRPLVSEEEFASLRQNPRYDDKSLVDFNRAFSEIRQRYDPILRRRSFSRHEMLFQIDEKGNSLSCNLAPASNSPAFDKELCEVAIKVVRWTPARDAFGVTVPADAKLVIGIGK